VHQFREKVRKVLQDNEREANLQSADPLLHTEVGIETVLFLLEHARRIRQSKGSLDDLLKLYQTTFHAHVVLLLKENEGTASIRYADYPLPEALKAALCKQGSFYANLARIRFTYTVESPKGELSLLEAQGHPKIATLLAVPLTIEDKLKGALALLTENPHPPTPGRIMLLAAAAEILSMGWIQAIE